MNRRSFLASLAAIAVGPKIADRAADHIRAAFIASSRPIRLDQWCEIEFEWEEYAPDIQVERVFGRS